MTTTAINDISDLARIIEERPEWFVREMREFVRVTQEQNRRIQTQICYL